MIAFVALHIYLDHAGTSLAPGRAPISRPNFGQNHDRLLLLHGLPAAPASTCATLERATVAKMVLQQTIRNIRSRRRKSRCLHTKERGGESIVSDRRRSGSLGRRSTATSPDLSPARGCAGGAPGSRSV